VPQPFVDSLLIPVHEGSAPLLGIGFELFLERRELGERRVRVGSLVAPPFFGSAGGEQAPFARRTRGTIGPRVTIRSRLAGWPRRPFGGFCRLAGGRAW
jgi:hypothetical protein